MKHTFFNLFNGYNIMIQGITNGIICNYRVLLFIAVKMPGNIIKHILFIAYNFPYRLLYIIDWFLFLLLLLLLFLLLLLLLRLIPFFQISKVSAALGLKYQHKHLKKRWVPESTEYVSQGGESHWAIMQMAGHFKVFFTFLLKCIFFYF